MSDNLSPYDELKFKDAIEIGSRSPALVKTFLSHDRILLTLDIKYPFLRDLQKSKLVYGDLTFVSILNTQLGAIHLKQCERLEERLRIICVETERKYKMTGGGRQKLMLNEKVKKLAVYDSEVVRAEQLSISLDQFRNENVNLLEKCKTLSKDLTKALRESQRHEEELRKASVELATVTAEKESLVECLGTYFNAIFYTSKL